MKTGQESPSYVVQVMIYLYAIPKALAQYRNINLRRQVTYSNPCECTVRTTYVIRGNEYRVMLHRNHTLTIDFLSRPLPATVNPANAGFSTRNRQFRHRCLHFAASGLRRQPE